MTPRSLLLLVGAVSTACAEPPAPESSPDAETPDDGRVEIVLDGESLDVELPGPARPIVLGYDEEDVVDGLPRAGAPPTFEWVGEPVLPASEMRTWVMLPPGWLAAMVLLDTDGDGRASKGEPFGQRWFDPEGFTPEVRFVLNRVYATSAAVEADGDPVAAAPVAGAGPSPAPGAEEIDPLAYRATLVSLDAAPREDVPVTSRLLFVGWSGDDLDPAAPPLGAPPVYFWTRLVRPIRWPIELEVRVPRHVRWYAVLDRDESGTLSLADLRSPPQPAAGPDAPRRLEIVLDRVVAPRAEAAP